MTQTLTTDELRQIVDSHEKGYGMSVPINYGYLAARELLANREAQPVASECDQDVYANGTSACLVVIPKETAEVICRGISAVTGCKVDWHYIGGRVHIKAIALPAPAVPEEIGIQEAKELFNYLMTEEELNATVNGYNACRAAMLAAAPEGGNG
ncbi:hypothetical protein [Serratia liquefaciens]|uniref:hypothetical protein n=1 Tax=Serratia liquefaciens TaxID=614 RepID=UPI0038030A50